ncbi:hypothetical protein [Parazoarcus communis]|uniref:hypothetical protein n=1 Tax=Parazoarcus communis TaxID=41977 RepID=UPI001403EC2A|nr:hypothetical protein [Parazoarcus communis]NMG71836.1 hypothetical protein [Parazoarcus communis SWub3 = DSM 12120]
MGIVIDMTAYRAAMRPAVSDACRWHAAIESITRSNIRLAAAWQRVLIRTWFGV